MPKNLKLKSKHIGEETKKTSNPLKSKTSNTNCLGANKLKIIHKIKPWHFEVERYSEFVDSGVLERQISLFEKQYFFDPCNSNTTTGKPKTQKLIIQSDYLIITTNWLPLLDKCIEQVALEAIHLLKHNQPIQFIQSKNKYWITLSNYANRITLKLHNNNMFCNYTIKTLSTTMKRRRFVKDRHDSKTKIHNHYYTTMKESIDNRNLSSNELDIVMINYFVRVYGPLKGREEYLEYASFISLQNGFSVFGGRQ